MALRKSIIKYEVVYDDEEINLDCVSLEEIHHMTTEGAASGRFLDSDEEILSDEEAYKALAEQGSDPDFMQLFKCESCGKIVRDTRQDLINEDILCPDCVK